MIIRSNLFKIVDHGLDLRKHIAGHYRPFAGRHSRPFSTIHPHLTPLLCINRTMREPFREWLDTMQLLRCESRQRNGLTLSQNARLAVRNLTVLCARNRRPRTPQREHAVNLEHITLVTSKRESVSLLREVLCLERAETIVSPKVNQSVANVRDDCTVKNHHLSPFTLFGRHHQAVNANHRDGHKVTVSPFIESSFAQPLAHCH